MQVTEIVVSAGRTFNHPYESYSNLKPHVTLKATIFDGDDAEACVKELQAKAESIVEDHKRNLLSSLEDAYELEQRQQRVQSLESSIRRAQKELDDLRKQAAQDLVPALASSCPSDPSDIF